MDGGRPVRSVWKSLPHAGLDHIVAGLHLGQLRAVTRCPFGKLRRFKPRPAAEVVLQRRIDGGVDIAVRVKLLDHVAAAIGIQGVDGLVDHPKAKVGADWLALIIAGKYVVGRGLLWLKDILGRSDVDL